MNIITQEAKKKQAVVKFAKKNGKSAASRQYGVSLSSVKRWCSKYDGSDWRSLVKRSHRPYHNPHRHTKKEERKIKKAFEKSYERYGWYGVYEELKRKGYKRSFSGMVYAAKRMGLKKERAKKPPRKQTRRYPELLMPGEKIQIDVKEVPYNCLRGDALKYGRRFYQWTAIDECIRYRFVYAFEEHTPENTVKFLKMLLKEFPFKIQKIQTDNGTEFTYKYIGDNEISPLDKVLQALKIPHILIPPRTPWHNGKVERSSHRDDQDIFTIGKPSRHLVN